MTSLLALLPTDGVAVRRLLRLVVLLGLLTKISLALLLSHNPQGVFESSDSHEYHQLALNIMGHASFSQSLSPPFEPETIRTPAYPLLLAGLYSLVGIRPDAVVAIQIALSAVTMLAASRIASLLFGARAGLLTAIFLVLDPVSLYYSQVMLTETLFAAALTLSVLGMLYVSGHPSLISVSWAGICLALAAYTRPTGYYLGVLLPAMLFFAHRRSHGWRVALVSAVQTCLVFTVLVGAWQIRNYVSTGSTEFSQAKNQYLLIAKAAGIVATRDRISLQEAQQRLAQEHSALLGPTLRRMSRVEVLESQGKFAQGIIAAHPLLLARTTLTGTAANLFGPSNLAHLFGGDNVALRQAFLDKDFSRFPLADWVRALGSWTFGLLFLVVLYTGIWLLVRQKGFVNPDIALLALTAAYVILVSSGPEAYSRFRMPIMPICCILAAGGYICRKGRRSERQAKGDIALRNRPDVPLPAARVS
ncbi:MAG TPA: glycosyltransferase family 39 protein [Nitrospira sp.]|nr:glycosyltransferase family 39 protein [Nitrospira sp.]